MQNYDEPPISKFTLLTQFIAILGSLAPFVAVGFFALTDWQAFTTIFTHISLVGLVALIIISLALSGAGYLTAMLVEVAPRKAVARFIVLAVISGYLFGFLLTVYPYLTATFAAVGFYGLAAILAYFVPRPAYPYIPPDRSPQWWRNLSPTARRRSRRVAKITLIVTSPLWLFLAFAIFLEIILPYVSLYDRGLERTTRIEVHVYNGHIRFPEYAVAFNIITDRTSIAKIVEFTRKHSDNFRAVFDATYPGDTEVTFYADKEQVCTYSIREGTLVQSVTSYRKISDEEEKYLLSLLGFK